MTRKIRSEDSPSYLKRAHRFTGEEAQQILAAVLMMSRKLEKTGVLMTDPSAAGDFCTLKLAAQQHEVFAAMFLDTRHRLIAWEELFTGTIDGAEVHPRVVVKRALELNASAVIFAHNHPSGSPEPSAADRAVTARLQQALALIECRVLDHFIVPGDGSKPTSMAQRGLM